MTQKTKDAIRSWFGPSAVRFGQRLLGRLYPSRLTYAPMAWDTPMSARPTEGWNERRVVDERCRGWGRIAEICSSTAPLGFSYEDQDQPRADSLGSHNVHLTFGYVVALAAREKRALSVLDWGGGLGHYYLIAKALVPDVALDYHCAEVPAAVEAGRVLNSDVTWYSGDEWSRRTFDVVMVNASLQYVRNWREFIHQITKSVADYFFLTRIPVVERGPGFLALQRESGERILHQQFQATELVRAVEHEGLRLQREFVVGDRPFIRGAPEQCEMRGWLFRR
jgi:putative methyltransferase (TIGR04325 family)